MRPFFSEKQKIIDKITLVDNEVVDNILKNKSRNHPSILLIKDRLRNITSFLFNDVGLFEV